MNWLRSIAFFTLINTCFSGISQNIRDSVIAVPMVGLHFSGQMAGGDLAKRFGNTLNVGIPFYYKTKSNLLIGFEANYFFGKTVKEQLLTNLYTPEGTITGTDGAPGRLRINERGINVYASIGKIFPVVNYNKNSGPFVSAGVGYMAHKANIYDVGKTLLPLVGDLKKGYDRLTGGVAFTQFIGYMHLSNNRLANFYAGFEFNEGFTKGLRGYQYDTGMPDNQKRVDLQYGARVGWILPLYKRIKDMYFY